MREISGYFPVDSWSRALELLPFCHFLVPCVLLLVARWETRRPLVYLPHRHCACNFCSSHGVSSHCEPVLRCSLFGMPIAKYSSRTRSNIVRSLPPNWHRLCKYICPQLHACRHMTQLEYYPLGRDNTRKPVHGPSIRFKFGHSHPTCIFSKFQAVSDSTLSYDVLIGVFLRPDLSFDVLADRVAG